ncbi:hypothetical protein TNIN_465361 [Trichonephila inaurata madagascariensis]|uniref:Uncharacterized protein n=1 Tax=Trichonephila inaurata madagascariensis TaxID=2747483 RepID=A0A8X6X9J4_9ARAC|nr:hypothetical protein TNIN_465361 [Trichonephila inaurata madagascariensis]
MVHWVRRKWLGGDSDGIETSECVPPPPHLPVGFDVPAFYSVELMQRVHGYFYKSTSIIDQWTPAACTQDVKKTLLLNPSSNSSVLNGIELELHACRRNIMSGSLTSHAFVSAMTNTMYEFVIDAVTYLI